MPKNTLNGKVQRKENRRVRYTRMVLRETLLSLLQQYPLNKITVSRICEQADVNRSTFYLYYKDAYDLLDQIETELVEQISQALEGTSYMLPNVEMLQRIYEIIYKTGICAASSLASSATRSSCARWATSIRTR